MFYLLYKITNIINGKFYVGVHKTENIADKYMGSGIHIQKAIKKYGIKYFQKEIIEECSSENEMYLLEEFIVTEELVKNKKCYNMKIGGFGKWPSKGSELALLTGEKVKKWWSSLDEEQRIENNKKIADGTRRIMNTSYIKKKISDSLKNRSKEIKQQQYKNISEGNRRYWNSLSKKERDQRREEQKKVMSNPEVRKRLSEAQKKTTLNKGENNGDFKSRWKPFYDSMIKKAVPLICDSDMPDSDIQKKLGGGFKMFRYLDYLHRHNYIKIIEIKRLHIPKRNIMKKTICKHGEAYEN